MSITELYNDLADLQGKTADICFQVKGCLFPIDMPESARDELSSLLCHAVKCIDTARVLALKLYREK